MDQPRNRLNRNVPPPRKCARKAPGQLGEKLVVKRPVTADRRMTEDRGVGGSRDGYRRALAPGARRPTGFRSCLREIPANLGRFSTGGGPRAPERGTTPPGPGSGAASLAVRETTVVASPCRSPRPALAEEKGSAATASWLTRHWPRGRSQKPGNLGVPLGPRSLEKLQGRRSGR